MKELKEELEKHIPDYPYDDMDDAISVALDFYYEAGMLERNQLEEDSVTRHLIHYFNSSLWGVFTEEDGDFDEMKFHRGAKALRNYRNKNKNK